MALTLTAVRSENAPIGKMSIFDCQFDNSYPTGGETIDLSAAAIGGFTAVTAVIVAEGPYTSTGGTIAPTVCTRIDYSYAASRAVATGKLLAYAESATGEETQVANTTDLSTVYCRILVIGR